MGLEGGWWLLSRSEMLRSFCLVFRQRGLQSSLPRTVLASRWCTTSSEGPSNPNVNIENPPVPEYKPRTENESIEQKKARLVYQSRKRGMLENGLLLSTFASRYLQSLTDEQLSQYDNLINKPSNDWEIYYWITGKADTPEEYDNAVMDMLKEHALNKEKEQRFSQPDLYA